MPVGIKLCPLKGQSTLIGGGASAACVLDECVWFVKYQIDQKGTLGGQCAIVLASLALMNLEISSRAQVTAPVTPPKPS